METSVILSGPVTELRFRKKNSFYILKKMKFANLLFINIIL